MRDLFDDRRVGETRRDRRVDVEDCAGQRRRDQSDVMTQRENRIERQDDAIVVIQGRCLMSKGGRVDVMRLTMTVNQQLVKPVCLRLVHMLHRRQREHRDAVGEHDSDDSGRRHALSSYVTRWLVRN